MRFYPFGSSSLNQLYISSTATSASLSTYALTASFATVVFTASRAVNGIPGSNGIEGQCIYNPGIQGQTGSVGLSGPAGGVSVPLPKP